MFLATWAGELHAQGKLATLSPSSAYAVVASALNLDVAEVRQRFKKRITNTLESVAQALTANMAPASETVTPAVKRGGVKAS